MSDRWMFVTAFSTVVLIVAGAFAIPQFFVYELIKSSIFVAIAVLVFFGEDTAALVYSGLPAWRFAR